MKTGIVGCGNISRCHFAALEKIDEVCVTAVCDNKPERADDKAALSGAKAYYDYDEMLNNEVLDCVHICTPHYIHTEMAVKALERGINVLIEKPCSVSVEEIERLRQAQKKSGKQVAVCFQNRYNSSTSVIKSTIDNGSMGKVIAIRAFVTWDRGEGYYSDDWHGTMEKECGGVLINQAIHTIDLMQYFAGGCKNLTAHVFNDHLKGLIEVEDTATVLMNLENDITGILYATTAFKTNSDVLIEVVFENGVMRMEGEKLYQLIGNGSPEELCQPSDEKHEGQAYWGHGHNALIGDFYDCLKTGRKFEIDAFEGGKAAAIVAGCYESKGNLTEIGD